MGTPKISNDFPFLPKKLRQKYHEYEIEIFDDQFFLKESKDNHYKYDFEHGGNSKTGPITCLGIKNIQRQWSD